MDPLAPSPLPCPPAHDPSPGQISPRLRRPCKGELAFFPPSAFDLFKSFVLKANEPKQQYPHWNIFCKLFLVIHCCKNNLWGIVTSRQTLGLFSNSEVLPQNSEFRKTDYPKIIHGYHSELKWTEQMPDWWIKYVWISNNLREQDIFQYYLKVS